MEVALEDEETKVALDEETTVGTLDEDATVALEEVPGVITVAGACLFSAAIKLS